MNLGQVAVFAGGAYITAILHVHGVNDLAIAMPASMVAAAFLGFLTGIPGVRLTGFALAMTSFFLVLLIGPLTNIFDSETGGAVGLPGLLNWKFAAINIDTQTFYVVAIAVTVAWFAAFRNLIRSRLGLSLQVLQCSSHLARSLGLSVFRLKVTAYVLGGLPAGIAGSLYAVTTGYIGPAAFPFSLAIAFLAASVIGGSKSIYGPLLGSAILVLGPLQVASFAKYSLLIYGLFLAVIATLFSGGLIAFFTRIADRISLTRYLRLTPETEGRSSPTDEVIDIPGEELIVTGVHKAFGGLVALSGVNLSAAPGQVTAIMGANGAGKTTLLNVISGLVSPDRGEVTIGGRRITGQRAHVVAQAGVGRTFQSPLIPSGLSVAEVVATGRLRHRAVSLLEIIFRAPSFHRARRQDNSHARVALKFAGMSDLATRRADSLPLGPRRLLEVVRSLASEPNVLLLDEPASGLDDAGLAELAQMVRRARNSGATIVLVEHNVAFLLSIADTVHVMHLGSVIASGSPEEIRENDDVVAIYLGRRQVPNPAARAAVTPSERARRRGESDA